MIKYFVPKQPEVITAECVKERFYWLVPDHDSDAVKAVVNFWLEHDGEHGPTYGDIDIKDIQCRWDRFIQDYEVVEE
jgi:hypothetical protein